MQNDEELFCPVEKKRIMAKPTFEGLVFSTTNLIALAKYLLAYGVEKVCLRIVTQDVLEALFGNLVSEIGLFTSFFYYNIVGLIDLHLTFVFHIASNFFVLILLKISCKLSALQLALELAVCQSKLICSKR